MKKKLLTLIAMSSLALQAAQGLAAAEFKVAAAQAEQKAGVNSFENFVDDLSENYPNLAAYLQKIKIFSRRGPWQGQNASPFVRVWYALTHALPLDGDLMIAQIKAFDDFRQLLRNHDYPDQVHFDQRIAAYKKDAGLYFMPLLQAHNKPFYEVWADAKTETERSLACYYLSNEVVDRCKDKEQVLECVQLATFLCQFVERNKNKISKSALEIILSRFQGKMLGGWRV